MGHVRTLIVSQPVSRERSFEADVSEAIDVDSSLAKLLSDWETTSKRHTGSEIPVGLIDRRSISESASTPGEVNYQYPMQVNGQWFLVVALEAVDSPNPAIIGHEILHWMLLDEGFRHVRPNHPFGRTRATQPLNDLTHHVPLNNRMIDYQIDYSTLQDVQTEGQIARIADGRFMKLEPDQEELWLFSFVAADLLLNCTPQMRPKLKATLGALPVVEGRTNDVLEVLQQFDLFDPSDNKQAQLKLIENYGMPPHVHVNNFEILKQKVT